MNYRPTADAGTHILKVQILKQRMEVKNLMHLALKLIKLLKEQRLTQVVSKLNINFYIFKSINNKKCLGKAS